MDKIKDFVKNKKKQIAIFGVAIVVIAVAIVVILSFGKSSALKQEENLYTELKAMGQDFYENYYYEYAGKSDEEREQYLSKYATIGIKINLSNLGRYNKSVNEEKIKLFVNKDTKEECDKEKTRAIIYPKAPYGKTDYDIKVELSCGFENNENKENK